MSIRKGSRYEKVRVYNKIDDNRGIIPTFQRRKLLKLRADSEVVRHQVKESETLDAIAYHYLGNSALWWVILDVNTQYLTPFDIQVGDILLIPTETAYRRAVDRYGV